jgi:hypothetical protein
LVGNVSRLMVGTAHPTWLFAVFLRKWNAPEFEGLRGDLAKMLTSRVKAATGLEGVSSEVARHEAQIETIRLEREKTIHNPLEAEGLEDLWELATQKAQQ